MTNARAFTIRERTRRNASPPEGQRQAWIEWQVCQGHTILSRHDTYDQAERALDAWLRLTEAQQRALKWLRDRGGDGVFDKTRVLVAAGERSGDDHEGAMYATWVALERQGLVEFYGGKNGRGRLRIKWKPEVIRSAAALALFIAAAYALLLAIDTSEAFAAGGSGSILTPLAIERGGVEVAMFIMAVIGYVVGFTVGKLGRRA